MKIKFVMEVVTVIKSSMEVASKVEGANEIKSAMEIIVNCMNLHGE